MTQIGKASHNNGKQQEKLPVESTLFVPQHKRVSEDR